MPDEPLKPDRPAPRRGRRFVVQDADDHRTTERIEEFLTGPRTRARPRGLAPAKRRGTAAVTELDTRTDFVAALAREARRFERYGRPATVIAVEFDIESSGGLPVDDHLVDRLAGPIGFTLLREARETDRIARVAPNRFHVLLPETELTDAAGYVERARTACEVWFGGAALAVRIRFEAASSSPRQSLDEALAAVEDRLTA
jgi:PleD family two-component response regulator